MAEHSDVKDSPLHGHWDRWRHAFPTNCLRTTPPPPPPQKKKKKQNLLPYKLVFVFLGVGGGVLKQIVVPAKRGRICPVLSSDENLAVLHDLQVQPPRASSSHAERQKGGEASALMISFRV